MRQIPTVVLALGLALAAAWPATAEEPQWRHGASLMGTPKYPPGFPHFDYVNPNAPKGGTLRLSDTGTFDSFNPILSTKGVPASGLNLVFEQLMAPAFDEVSTEYGELAEALKYPDDFAWVAFRLNPAARWHDGQPVTPEDVVWSFEAIKAHNSSLGFYYQHVVKAEVTGEREVKFTFDQPGNRELPHIVGQLTVLPKHWWTATGPDGKPRSIAETTLEPPLGSGPYRLRSFEPGRTLVYARVEDYWGARIPTHVGADNFDEIRWDYFRDDTVELEAFKGDAYDVRLEASAKNWATAYDFPARKEGRVVLDKIPSKGSGIMAGFIPNLRRDKFKDARVRLALSYAMPFEDMNRTLFFDQYERPSSYFYPTELAATGLPDAAETAILKEAEKAGRIPPEVYTTPFANPRTPDARAERANLKTALDLFAAAGWTNKGGKLVDAAGEPFRIEFLIVSGSNFERVGVRYREQLAKIGIELTVRGVDSAQFTNRVRSRDYDMIFTGWAQSLSPGNEQFDYFGSEAAKRESSRNYAGIADPAVDALIKRVVYAENRADLVAASRALDRVLLWNHYVVPGWTLPATRMARWDRFSHPDPLPPYSTAFPAIWWWDAAKASKTGAAK